MATGRPEAHQLAAVAVAARDDHVCESIGLGGKTLWQLCGVSWSRSAVQDGSHRCVAVHTFWSRSVVQDWRHRGMGVRLCGDVDSWMCGCACVDGGRRRRTETMLSLQQLSRRPQPACAMRLRQALISRSQPATGVALLSISSFDAEAARPRRSSARGDTGCNHHERGRACCAGMKQEART